MKLTAEEIKDLIGEEAVANLQKLSEYLQSSHLRAEFNMRYFANTDSDSLEDYTATDCGTVGCAAGHGPYAGIPKHPTESWADYSYRAFLGFNLSDYEDYEDYEDDEDEDEANVERIWHWLFHGAWEAIDNTPKGAGQRIDYLLKYGLPDNSGDQICGLAPITYKVAP